MRMPLEQSIFLSSMLVLRGILHPLLFLYPHTDPFLSVHLLSLDFKGKNSQTKDSWSFLSGPVELIFTEHLLNAKQCEHREE